MNMPIPPSSSSSRSLDSTATQAELTTHTAALAIETFNNKLAGNGALTEQEQLLLARIATAIFEGELDKLETAVAELANAPTRKNEFTDFLAKEIRCPGVAIMPLQSARWRFAPQEEAHEISIFAIHLIKAKRILAVATDVRFGAHVYSAPDSPGHLGLSAELSEDARILLKQMGRIATFGNSSCPPPFYTGG